MGAMTLAADSRSSPMSSTTRTFNQLCLSPYNVRTNEDDANATEVLEASIAQVGLMHALNVHPMRGSTSKWGVFAGGRRYRAIGKLIAAGTLPADYAIKVEIYDKLGEAKLVVGSLTENGPRCDLRDYEICAGVVRAHALGESIDDIAHDLGQRPLKVRQWVKVGQLAKPVFAAYAAGALSLDQAQAFAARDDHKLQAAVFAEVENLHFFEKTPDKIRARLKVGDRELGRQLLFVGDDAYRDAGGRFEFDLFADGEERGAVVDEGVLAKLVGAKLETTRADLRRRTGRELRFIAQPPETPGYTFADVILCVTPEEKDDGTIKLPEGDIVAHLVIGESGEPRVTWWWSSRQAKFGSEKGDAPRPALRAVGGIAGAHSPAAAAAGRAIAQEEGLTAETVEIFRSLRLSIMRAALVEDAGDGGDVGVEFLIWSQLRLLLDNKVFANQIGVARLSGATTGPEAARPFLSGMPATRIWLQTLMELQQRPMMTDADLGAAFDSFCQEPARIKKLAGAMVAGFALDRSLNAEGYSAPVHDMIAAMVGLGDDAAVRFYWEPTAELLDRIPIKQRLAIAEPFMESAAFAPWSRLKSSALTRAVLTVVDGTAQGIRSALKDRAANWVHPLLRFTPPGAAIDQAPATAELEAAE
ncbi:hypothetical protein BH10PSE14_BH10PSE14_04720 [soil metagenome]